MFTWKEGKRSLVIPNSSLADGHSKRLHRLSHNFCRLANSANSELAQMLSAGCLLCYSTSLCFWNYYHFKLHRRTKSTAPPLLTPVFAFKSILQEQPEQQIHFLALVWATITLSKHPSRQHHQLLWKWETNCVTSWCSFSLNLLVTDLGAGNLWIPACPAITQRSCHSTWSKRGKSHLLRAVKKKPPS